MTLNKKNKKDELKGAINNELSSNGIMGEFVNNLKNDKNNNGATSKSEESGSLLESIKSIAQKSPKDKGGFGDNLPMIRNRTRKEWWVSLAAFFTVILLIFLLFFGFGSENKYELALASSALDNYAYGAAVTNETFESGKPVYVYFAAKKAINSNKIFIQVINLNQSSDESKMSLIESNINPNWKIVETHFQKEYFENPGKYKIIIENEKKKVLVEKIFTVR
jgi:hypothetical protein